MYGVSSAVINLIEPAEPKIREEILGKDDTGQDPSSVALLATRHPGSVALSRHLEPQSGTVQFFIDVVDNPRFDFTDKSVQGWGFTVFGKVVQGMDVVDRIAATPTLPNGVPVTPVVIKRAYVDTTAAAPASSAK